MHRKEEEMKYNTSFIDTKENSGRGAKGKRLLWTDLVSDLFYCSFYRLTLFDPTSSSREQLTQKGGTHNANSLQAIIETSRNRG
jgi:hypothetical protein